MGGGGLGANEAHRGGRRYRGAPGAGGIGANEAQGGGGGANEARAQPDLLLV